MYFWQLPAFYWNNLFIINLDLKLGAILTSRMLFIFHSFVLNMLSCVFIFYENKNSFTFVLCVCVCASVFFFLSVLSSKCLKLQKSLHHITKNFRYIYIYNMTHKPKPKPKIKILNFDSFDLFIICFALFAPFRFDRFQKGVIHFKFSSNE